MTSSGSSTLSVPSLYNASASDDNESTYLKRMRILHWSQLVLALIIFSVAVSVIGCEAAPLRHYMATSAYKHVWLSLWPLNFDLRPTVGLLSCGCIIVFQSMIYVVAALLPSHNSHIKALNILATAHAFSGFITALVGVAFGIYLPSSKYPSGFTKNETLQSWTCKWKRPLDGSNIDSDDTYLEAPAHFARDCAASRAGFALTCALIGLEVVMGIAAAAGYLFMKRMAKRRNRDMSETLEVKVMDPLSDRQIID